MVLPCGKVGAVPIIPTLEPTATTADYTTRQGRGRQTGRGRQLTGLTSPVKTNSLPLMLLFCTLFDSSTPLPPICAQGHR